MARVSKQSEQFVLRLPDGMRDRIKAAADANARSMNSEIVATLEEAYPAVDPDAAILELIEELQTLATKALPPRDLQDFDAFLDGLAFQIKGKEKGPEGP